MVQPKINLSKNYMDVQWLGHENRYYFFGGKDESSYTLIQGITLAGVLLDEAALMPAIFCGSGSWPLFCHGFPALVQLQSGRQ